MTTLATSPSKPSPMTAPAATGKKFWTRVLWLLWAACLGLGAIGIYQRIAYGHMPAGYGSYVPWGLWIAIYFHGVGIAGGAFAVASLGYILNLQGFRHPAALRAAIVLAFASMIPALIAVWLDLGHMARATNILTSPSFTSMMAFNAWMYNAFMLIAAVCWLISYRRRSSGWLRPLLCLGVLIAVVFPSQSGAFFGVVDAKPYWHSALMPIMFLASAITAGAAMLLLIRGIIGIDSPAGLGDSDPSVFTVALSRLRKVVLAGLVVYFLLEFAEFSIVMWNTQTHAPALDLILLGPYWWVFWIVHLCIGGVLPLALLLTQRPRLWIVAGLLVAVTFISTRLNVLVPGQAVGEIKGLQEAFSHPRLSYTYHATTMEYLVGLFLVGVGMTIYFVGRRISKLVAARAA
ncbi:MAG: NrfD/PsrC family molybdoenzyme membrane anchor subunit [Phycisphaerales bacterium]